MNSTFTNDDLEILRNRTFDEIAVGDRATIQRTLTQADLQLFAALSGAMWADAAADIGTADSVIAHGMWGAALVAPVLGGSDAPTGEFPDATAIYAGDDLECTGTLIEVAFGAIANTTKVVSGEVHSCALAADSKVRCWGASASGELGRPGAAAAEPSAQIVQPLGIVSPPWSRMPSASTSTAACPRRTSTPRRRRLRSAESPRRGGSSGSSRSMPCTRLTFSSCASMSG